VPGYGLSGCGPAVGFPARSSSPMPYGSGSAAGDVGVARTGSRITRAMRPCAARGETSGPRPLRQRGLAGFEQAQQVVASARREEGGCLVAPQSHSRVIVAGGSEAGDERDASSRRIEKSRCLGVGPIQRPASVLTTAGSCCRRRSPQDRAAEASAKARMFAAACSPPYAAVASS
jgi:hypothetical protein